ncbi:glycosyl transferase [Microbacterium neungamense]|uniref:glycosyl transferase n=1 Tax=Microbacterium neungamense TaxID=2810535 RepID=UPI00217DEA00|nr:glycosyl transferase [Microbacterium neungamense]UWF78491.1 glycosyl transferase [Microbacterium neungamense]
MRFVWAVLAFVLATLLIGAGIAQRTVFMGPSQERMELSIEDPEPYVLVDAEVLRANPGLQTLLVRGEGEIFVAYGRTADMTAWLSDTAYNHVSLTRTQRPKTEHVDAAQPREDGAATSGRNPAGSDLWLDSFSDEDALVAEMQLTEGVSVLIARDGVEDAPTDILVSWPLDTRTPWAGPLIAAGCVVLAAGLVLYVLAIRHQRRGRGPRRKGPGPLPPTEPIALAPAPARAAVEAGEAADGEVAAGEAGADRGPADAAQGTSGAKGTDEGTAPRTAHRRRRIALALPAVVVTAVLATGCSPESWPQFGESSPTPSPSPSVVAPENQKPPAVTESQAVRIVQQIASTLEQADAERNIDLAATRLDGAALDARRTDYALRAAIPDRPAPAGLPSDKLSVVLPEATETWPRTVLVLAASESDETVPPVILTMTQADPWSNYRITSMAEMPAAVEFPDVAPAWLGATRVPAESPFLALAPGEVAAGFSDLVDSGDASAFGSAFDSAANELAASIRESRAAVVQGLSDRGAAETSSAAFDMAPTDKEPVSLATLDSGAVVTVSVTDTETITPTTPDAVIRFGDNAEAKALTGVGESAKGVVTTYALQLFFAVPAQGSSEQIRLLAVHQDLIGVSVIK